MPSVVSRTSNLPVLAALAAGLMGLALVLSFFVAPEDADQGISQRIFYIHVPIALTAYFCFGLGAWKALLLLWRGDERYDLESYVAIHQGTIFGSLTLITGAIWAKASWGVWWTWDSNQLVLFLTLFLFYCAYFMLRFSLPEGPRRARSAAVYALVRGRVDPDQLPRDQARRRLHPPDDVHARRTADDRHDVHGVLRVVGGRDAPGLRPVSGRARGETVAHGSSGAARGPGVSGGEYVALAYAVVFVFVLVYVAIIAAKLVRLQRDTAELLELVRRRESSPDAPLS